jgi:hypothetical protein
MGCFAGFGTPLPFFLQLENLMGNHITTSAALVVLLHSVSLNAAIRGCTELNGVHWGAAAQGEDYTTFSVRPDWDGHRFAGYFTPTLAQVALDTHRDWWQQFEQVGDL